MNFRLRKRSLKLFNELLCKLERVGAFNCHIDSRKHNKKVKTRQCIESEFQGLCLFLVVFNMDTFRWSFGFLFSRLVRLPSMDGKVALVPWADMLNHSCEVETFLDYDKSSQGVVFTTDRAYQPGEQVFISYGKKSNGELLLSYGFVPKEGTNPSDSVELPLSLKKSDKCYKEKLEALKKHGLSASQCYPIQITGWPLELMAYAYCFCLYHFTCVLWTIFFNFMEVFVQVLVSFMWVVLLQLKPGLSYYAKDPQAAANSLTSLLDKAESATAGLRALGGEAFDKILQSVRELLKSRSTLKSEANGVKILDGSQEGSYDMLNFLVLLYFAFTLHIVTGLEYLGGPYIIAKMQFNPCIIEPIPSRDQYFCQISGDCLIFNLIIGQHDQSCLRCFHGGAGANWRNPRGFSGVTINYLLGNLGRTYQDTVGIVDLGGGSVQMAYAISKNAASRAPSLPAGQDNYVNEMYLKGSNYYLYYLYVHRYPPF
ncbi:hypothetical protein CXB51_005787 [Gossypium anomalum]|uniref:apyrase n=1 Tax=Gossypium anomalum TaxID=47600 RepID=A0A8J5YYW1_9ROSI|nr:hypothetical protein CXB51_005787 [Gossypium anomalum]